MDIQSLHNGSIVVIYLKPILKITSKQDSQLIVNILEPGFLGISILGIWITGISLFRFDYLDPKSRFEKSKVQTICRPKIHNSDVCYSDSATFRLEWFRVDSTMSQRLIILHNS